MIKELNVKYEFVNFLQEQHKMLLSNMSTRDHRVHIVAEKKYSRMKQHDSSSFRYQLIALVRHIACEEGRVGHSRTI